MDADFQKTGVARITQINANSDGEKIFNHGWTRMNTDSEGENLTEENEGNKDFVTFVRFC
jgi:hypothetical protein